VVGPSHIVRLVYRAYLKLAVGGVVCGEDELVQASLLFGPGKLGPEAFFPRSSEAFFPFALRLYAHTVFGQVRLLQPQAHPQQGLVPPGGILCVSASSLCTCVLGIPLTHATCAACARIGQRVHAPLRTHPLLRGDTV